MKSSQIIITIFALACAWSGDSRALAGHRSLQFPVKGMPYADARTSLLKQGLVVTRDPRPYSDARHRAALRERGIFVPEKLAQLDKRFPEIDCWWMNKSKICEALFLETFDRGWRNYVVVDIDPKYKTVIEANYPSEVDGLPAIPGPLPSDVPHLKGYYLDARRTLRKLGFRPALNHDFGIQGRVCFDSRCNRYVMLPETECLDTGMGYCDAYLISPNKQVLRVTTVGEYRQIYFIEWSTWKNLRADFDN